MSAPIAFANLDVVELGKDPARTFELASRQIRVLRAALEAIERQADGDTVDSGELAAGALEILDVVDRCVQALVDTVHPAGGGR